MIRLTAPALPRAGLVLIGLGAAVALRLAVAGDSGMRSVSAGLVFATALTALAVAGGWRPGRPRIGPVAAGVLGGSFLTAFPARLWLGGGTLASSLSIHQFAPWAVVVTLVAVAEELILRGVLFAAIHSALGPFSAVAVTSIVFALLHVPLYGLEALPLDLAVGVWLGCLRLVTGSVVAPALAHTLADLASWWLV